MQLIRPRHGDFGQNNDVYGSACFPVQMGSCVIVSRVREDLDVGEKDAIVRIGY